MTPLILLVGFLGAGKTTFLKKLLPHLSNHGLIPRIIINDYQNAHIDSNALAPLAKFVRPLNGSCVCCESSEELFDLLWELPCGPQEIVLLETNGSTDALNLVEMLSLDPRARKFTLPIQLSIIDGKRWQKRYWHNQLEMNQTQTATHYIISHDDEISPARHETVLAQLQKNNPRASLTTPDAFAQTLAQLTQQSASLPQRQPDSSILPTIAPAHASHHFASQEVALPSELSRPIFEQWLQQFPREILRAKGVVRFQESLHQLHFFQYVADPVQILIIEANKHLSLSPVLVWISTSPCSLPHFPTPIAST